MTASVPAFGPWVPERVLGQGSYGVVHEVRHSRTGERAALKAMRLGSDDPRALRRFEREVGILRRLDHPGIVRVLDSGEEGGSPWVALELLRGMTLAETTFVLREWVELLARIARAVGAAHRAGIVHRDLKPSNVIIAAEGGAAKVIDFGLAYDARLEATRLSQPGEVMGTLAYIAPEVLRGDALPDDPRRDVYSLGVMLHERLAGENPFCVGAPHMGLFMERILHGAPALAGRPGLDAVLARIVDRACAVDLATRPADGDALASLLEAWLQGEPRASVPARRLGLVLSAGAAGLAFVGIFASLVAASGKARPAVAPSPVAPVPSLEELRPSPSSGPRLAPAWEVSPVEDLLLSQFKRGGYEEEITRRTGVLVARFPDDPRVRFLGVFARAFNTWDEFDARRELVRMLREKQVPPQDLAATSALFRTLGFDRAACCVGDELFTVDAARPVSLRAEEMRQRIVGEPPVAYAARAEALALSLLAEPNGGDPTADPPPWYLRIALSNARVARDDFAGAVSALDLAITEAPSEVAAHLENERKAVRQKLVSPVLVGRHFASRHATTRFVSAVCYQEERAIETDPERHPEGLLDLARAAETMGHWEHGALARLRAARIFRETQREALARQVLDASLVPSLHADVRSLVLRALARSLLAKESPDPRHAEQIALDAARDADGFDPRAPAERADAWALVARARLAMGDREGARDAVSRGRRLAPRDARELDEVEKALR